MERQHVDEWREFDKVKSPLDWRIAWAVRDPHTHVEGLGVAGDAATQRAIAYDAERAPGALTDRIVQCAPLVQVLPGAGLEHTIVFAQPVRERDQAQRGIRGEAHTRETDAVHQQDIKAREPRVDLRAVVKS